MVSMLNFKGLHGQIGHYNLQVMYGPPMSGKTLAATCIGMITGMAKNQISSRNTQAFLSEVFVMSTMPFLWDDPTQESEVRQVCVDLGNAAFRGKFKEGSKIPQSGCLVTANFDLNEKEKYYSRICIIPFKKLTKQKKCGEGPSFEKKAISASAALPQLIQMAAEITMPAISTTVEMLNLHDAQVELRIMEGIAVPCYLASEILKACDMRCTALEDYCYELMAYRDESVNVQGGETAAPADQTILATALLAGVGKDVQTVLRLHNNKLHLRVKEFGEIVGINLVPEFKRNKRPLYQRSFRFQSSTGKILKKCAVIPEQSLTTQEMAALRELLDPEIHEDGHPDPQDPQDPEQTLADPMPEHTQAAP